MFHGREATRSACTWPPIRAISTRSDSDDGDASEIAANDAPDGTTPPDRRAAARDGPICPRTRYGFQNGPTRGEYTLALETRRRRSGRAERAGALPYGAPLTGSMRLEDVGRQ